MGPGKQQYRIAFFTVDWNYELVESTLHGLKRYADDHENVYIYIFDCLGKDLDNAKDRSEYIIFDLPDLRKFDGVLVQGNQIVLKRVRDAIERIRKIGLDTETVNVCYVLDPQRVLLGTVALRYLVMADPDTVIGEMMNENIISINTTTDQEEAAMAFQKYDFTAMPVVDNENRMVGIITIDDIVDIIQEEATEDIEKMAAILPTDRPYFKTFRAVWKEIRVAAMCGVTLSLCNFVKLLVVDRIPIQVAAIVCMTLVVVVLIAKVIGCVLPLTAEHIGFDPAVMASPFITTIVDAISLTVYFTIAKMILHI